MFHETSTCQDILRVGGSVFLRVGRHKKESVQLGEDVAVVATARADRPYFPVMVADPPGESEDSPLVTEWSHPYVAMGLPKKHELQDVILCRVYNLELAACYIKSASQMLGLSVHTSLISSCEEPSSQEEGERRWDQLLKLVELHLNFQGSLTDRYYYCIAQDPDCSYLPV